MPATAEPLELTPAVQTLVDSLDDPNISREQKVVYALMVRTFQGYRKSVGEYAQSLFWVIVVALALGFGMAFGFVGLTYGVLHWLFGTWTNAIIYVVAGFTLLLAFAIKLLVHETDIEFRKEGGRADGIKWGRLDDVFRVGAFLAIFMFLGAVLGSQVGLLYFTSDHAGIDMDGEFVECTVASLDNMCHGIFLDVFELYNLELTDAPITHTAWSATVFLFFRLAYDALFIVLLYLAYQVFVMRKLFDDLPDAGAGYMALADWMDETSRHERNWPRKFADEFVFLMLAEEYLRGNFKVVQDVSHQFPHVKVSDSLRALFKDARGAQLVEPRPGKTSG